MTISTAIARLLVHGKACTGVKYAPDQPADNISVYPFVVSYPGSGDLSGEAYDQTRDIHQVIVEFHGGPRTMVNLAIKNITPYIEEFARKLVLDPTLNGACSTIVFPVHYEMVFVEWSQVVTCALRFTVPIKIRGQAST